ncbi:hypothetical protein AVEN_238370-1 [Araneus ventricosus]|uniref:Uncharacterized protein n=1 Tax=Araneus ventricosus TaxID=182803 RepID=A0A4Y2KAD9_ARAVE|nr:hypothetical protein AVEN_238370-1 [Araneus ventricosus]
MLEDTLRGRTELTKEGLSSLKEDTLRGRSELTNGGLSSLKVDVGCSLSENGTFGRPKAQLRDKGTGYRKTGLSRSKQDYRTVPFKTGLQDCLVQSRTYGHITWPKLCHSPVQQ